MFVFYMNTSRNKLHISHFKAISNNDKNDNGNDYYDDDIHHGNTRNANTSSNSRIGGRRNDTNIYDNDSENDMNYHVYN